jgi:hypothetical protein
MNRLSADTSLAISPCATSNVQFSHSQFTSNKSFSTSKFDKDANASWPTTFQSVQEYLPSIVLPSVMPKTEPMPTSQQYPDAQKKRNHVSPTKVSHLKDSKKKNEVNDDMSLADLQRMKKRRHATSRSHSHKTSKSTSKKENQLIASKHNNSQLAKPRNMQKKETSLVGSKRSMSLQSKRERLHLMATETSQSNSTRVEHSETHYDPTSGHISKVVKDIKEETSKTKRQELELLWQQEFVKRTAALTELKQLPLEKAAESKTFQYYLKELRREISNFVHAQIAFLEYKNKKEWDLVHNKLDMFKDPLIQRRFLFGLPEQAEFLGAIPDPDGSQPVWLACLWSMEEMLQLCNDPKCVEGFKDFRLNKKWYLKEWYRDDTMFFVSRKMMSGYITGLMLWDNPMVQNVLSSFMRNEVLLERSKPYFPTFEEYQGDDLSPYKLLMTYDFGFVSVVTNQPIPIEKARYCNPKDTCNVVQDTVDIEGRFIQCIPDPMIRGLCFREFESQALTQPFSSDNYNGEFEELTDFMTDRQKIDDPTRLLK